jgi:hypothetical protein
VWRGRETATFRSPKNSSPAVTIFGYKAVLEHWIPLQSTEPHMSVTRQIEVMVGQLQNDDECIVIGKRLDISPQAEQGT